MNDPEATHSCLPDSKDSPAINAAETLPSYIGRYRVERILGKGGFGLVFLSFDEKLGRNVAVKVPHPRLVARQEQSEAYLTEARTVANLDHPNIVPVFDVGSTDNCPCFVVSKFIDGNDLSTRLKQSTLTLHESVELVATVAEALHYAHRQGLVHRDVKPGNILLDKNGTPYVSDFGLALREQEVGKGPRYAGTPTYMSPEQACGEGHRVDGRSDVFSLGVVFYELLTGKRPFNGETQQDLLEQITTVEARPPRQINDAIPKELERICLKSLAKRASERYTTAKDLADDLQHFLTHESSTANRKNLSTSSLTSGWQVTAFEQTPAPILTPSSDNQPVSIIPKGLRSFDAHDADFFLELLPGPRDREGIPDSLRFWKTRIEESDAESTFSVGLIYGPSGCGKSSLVKAGLLPRLSENVIAVYVEATGEETEARLLNGLRKRCTALLESLPLKSMLVALRQGQGIPAGKKIVIILDQFEQWLHAKKEEQNSELVQALRQCDGGRLQCIVMVRDDFWMAATRFMRELEVKLIESQNSAAVDLFSTEHARKVLAAFGRAFGKVPGFDNEASKNHKQFLEQAVSGLALEGKVISVRLSLFAEMMKGKEWTPATLKEVGGTKGVGVTFLEETFSASTAPPEHRYHQKSARAVLKDLLPDSGTDIKGYMRSYADLLDASGYGSRPQDFDDLIRILDSELRLITPTDPEGAESDDASGSHVTSGQKYYQLTHDYLVHSLREWLTRKQKETRRGRAELKLFDTTATWNSKPEIRFLPSWWENLTIRLFTDNRKWSEPQRRMMKNAATVHGIRTCVVVLLFAGITLAGAGIRNAIFEQRLRAQAEIQEKENLTRAEGLVASLLNAEIGQVPTIISDLAIYRKWANPLLKAKFVDTADGSAAKLALALAQLPIDHSQTEYLTGQLPICTLEQFPVVRKALLPHKEQLTDALWQVALDDSQPSTRRFQVAGALAEYAPNDNRWKQAAPFFAEHLTSSVPPVYLGQWRALFEPGGKALAEPLIAIHADRSRSGKIREAAALVLSDYLRDDPERLTDVILVADEFGEFSPLVDVLKPHERLVKQKLIEEMKAEMPSQLAKTNDQIFEDVQQLRDAHLKRQSLAAVTLVHLGYGDQVWSLLTFNPDPSLRSFIIHYLGKLGTDYRTLSARLELEGDVSIRRALVQSLGGLDSAHIPPADRRRIVELLQELYVRDIDPGIHGASSWALRKWKASLPKVPIGDLVVTEEQLNQVAKLNSEVSIIKRQIEASLRELPMRQISWERQLTEGPTALPESLTQALLSHYPLDETEGKEITDSVTGQSAGVYAEADPPAWVNGVTGHAARLNGNGGHFNCGSAFNPERSDSFSLGGWFLADPDGKRGALCAKFNNADEQGVAISVDPSANEIIWEMSHHFPENTLIVKAKVEGLAGQWHHLFITCDGSSVATGVRVYFDGLAVPLRVEKDILTKSILVSMPLQIGKRDTLFPFQGALDDLRIYNRCLTEKEVKELHVSGLRSLVDVPPESRTAEQQDVLTAACRRQDTSLRLLEGRLATAELALNDSHWKGRRRWYINSQEQTMMVIPVKTPERNSQSGNALAVSCHEVTVAEFHRFRPEHVVDRSVAPTDDCPVVSVSWFDAVEYCNWLSLHENIPEDQWAYEPNKEGQYADGMKIRENTVGYRLPTEEEWESACRSQTNGSYSFGESILLLKQYSWYGSDSVGRTYPAETLLPNDAGLFDVHGNTWEWTQNPVSAPLSPVNANIPRWVRSGSFHDVAPMVRSAYRDSVGPTYRYNIIGLRLVRTLPPVAQTN